MVWRVDPITAAWKKKLLAKPCRQVGCLAPAGSPCVYPGGKPQRGFHTIREADALGYGKEAEASGRHLQDIGDGK